MSNIRLKDLPVEVRLSHFKNLVTAAGVDGVLEEAERTVLGFVAQRWGMSQQEVDTVYSSPDSIESVVTSDRAVCAEQLYDIVEMAIIDGVLKRDEKVFCQGIARQLGFVDGDVDVVIQGILEGNRQGLNEEAMREKVRANLS